MNAISSANSNVLARDINRLLTQRGGQEVPGLEGLDPKKLVQLRDQLQSFSDQFETNAAQSAEVAMLADNQALQAFRDLAKFASQKVTQAEGKNAMGGFCGGGGGAIQQQPPAAPQPPPVFSPEAPNTPGPIGGNDRDNVVGGGNGRNIGVGPLAVNGSNFNPLAMNTAMSAALVASSAASQVGAASPLSTMQALARTGGVDQNLSALREAGGGGGFFEDKVFALMIKIVEDMQKKIEQRLEKLQKDAEAAEKGGKKGGKGGGLGGLVKGIVGVAAPIVGTALGGPVGGMIGGMVGNAVSGGGGGGLGGALGGGGGGGGGANGSESRNIEFEKIKFDMQKLSQMQQALSNILNTMDELAKSAIRHIKAG